MKEITWRVLIAMLAGALACALLTPAKVDECSTEGQVELYPLKEI
jgi:hypothetical protein